jgi:signal transduction histidine kinase
MAAVVAHEVRNPLAGIKGAMQVLAARRSADDPEASIMGDMVGRIDSLSALINDLLLFAGPAPPRLTPVAVGPLLEQAAELARRDPAGAGVEIRIAGADDDVIEADPELLKGLFVNLFLNAAQAMSGHAAQVIPGTGHVDVTVRTDPSDVTISVRDHGPGIPEHIGDQIFEPFFTTKSRGGGLGLAISRRTAELHDGSLEWRRPQDGGAELVVTLARKPLPASGAAPALASESVE